MKFKIVFFVGLVILSAQSAGATKPKNMRMGPPPPGDVHIVGDPVPNWKWEGRSRASSQWESMGPKPILNEFWSGNDDASGRVVSIATHPQNANIAYIASASGGVWKTIDKGVSWTPLTDELSILNHGCVALDPSSPETVYIGTGEYTTGSSGDGIFKSTNGGADWAKLVDDSVVGSGCSGFIVSPNDSNILHYSGASGYYRSIDGGQNWTNILSGAVSSLSINPVNPSIIYAGKHFEGVYKSIDGGVNWNLLTTDLPQTGVNRVLVAVASSQPDTVYTAILTGSSLLGFYRSDDAGISWTQKTNTPDFPSPQGGYDAFITVNPTNPEQVFAGGVFPTYAVAGVIKTDDGGDNWVDVTIGSNDVQVHPDMHFGAFSNDGSFWVGCDGGVWRTDDQGVNWNNLNSSLTLTQNYQIAIKPGDDQVILGGTQDNGTVGRTLGNAQWPQVVGGDGGFLAYDFNNTQIRYTTYVYLRVFRFNGGGFAEITGPWSNDSSNFIAPLVIDPNDSDTLLGGTDRVWRTTDASSSANWVAISDQQLVGGSRIQNLAVANGASDTIFVSGNNGQFKVTTDATTWLDRSAGLPSNSASDILPVNNDSNAVWVSIYRSTGDRIFYSSDLGVNWLPRSNGLPSGVTPRSMQIVEWGGQTVIFIGSGSGVWWSKDLGQSWAKDDHGLPNVNVADLRLNAQKTYIYVGSYGRGVWRASLSGLLGAELLFKDSFDSP